MTEVTKHKNLTHKYIHSYRQCIDSEAKGAKSQLPEDFAYHPRVQHIFARMSRTRDNTTAMNKMSHSEIWDDSLLVNSWNEALEEYKVKDSRLL